jgi:SAM-dependent methyltransferase
MSKWFANVGRKFRRIVSGLGPAPRSVDDRREEWSQRHQPFELRFHQGQNYRWDDDAFFAQWDEVFGRFLGLRKDAFGPGSVLLDVGCGSRPVLDWFTGESQKYFLDPLLAEFCRIERMSPYWRGKSPDTLFSQPAEQPITQLFGRCDFVNCWNVLDHTYDWRQILQNVRDYARPGGLVCIGTDFRAHGDGHPGIDDRGYFDRFLGDHFRLDAVRSDYVHRELALKLVRS